MEDCKEVKSLDVDTEDLESIESLRSEGLLTVVLPVTELQPVPVFGEWEQQRRGGGDVRSYSREFARARELRKRRKTNVSLLSLGNEDELGPRSGQDLRRRCRPISRSTKTMKKILKYFCCAT